MNLIPSCITAADRCLQYISSTMSSRPRANSHRTEPQGHFGTAPRHGATFGRAQSQRKLLGKWRISLGSPVPGPLNQNQPWVCCSWLSCAAKLHKAAQTLTVREISLGPGWVSSTCKKTLKRCASRMPTSTLTDQATHNTLTALSCNETVCSGPAELV